MIQQLKALILAVDLNSIPSTHISPSQLPVTPASEDLIPLTPGPFVLMAQWPLNHLPPHRHAHMHIIKIKILKRSLQERHDVRGHGTPRSRARIFPGTIASHQSPVCELATPQAFVCLYPTRVWYVRTYTNTHVAHTPQRSKQSQNPIPESCFYKNPGRKPVSYQVGIHFVLWQALSSSAHIVFFLGLEGGR